MSCSTNCKSTLNSLRVIVFVGPQGSGKSTLATPLVFAFRKQGYRSCVYKMIDYTIFQNVVFYKLFIKSIYNIVKDNIILVRFYEDSPYYNIASPRVFIELFPLLLFFHILGTIISVIKFTIARALLRCNVIIEDEGFTFKQIADVIFLYIYNYILAKIVYGTINSLIIRLNYILLKYFVRFLLILTYRFDVEVVCLYADYNSLKQRYRARGSYTEPPYYVHFQKRLYTTIIKISKKSMCIDSTKEPIGILLKRILSLLAI